jgi:signal peptidase
VSNAGWVPVVVYLEPGSSGIDAHPDSTTVDARGAVLVTLRLSAPRETGYYHRSIVEHRYLAVLPRPVLDELYAVHPWVPIVVIDALLGVSFYGCAIVVLGRRRFKKRTRKGPSLLSRFG